MGSSKQPIARRRPEMTESATKCVLVTGATGFIGRRCLPLLTAEWDEVHAVSRNPPVPADPIRHVVWHKADALSMSAMAQVLERAAATHWLHLAWVTEHGRYWYAPDNLEWLAASLQLVRLFAERGGRRLVTAGTCAEYAPASGVCREASTPAAPETLYGQCKHGLQRALTAYSARRGWSYAHTRIFNVYGPGEDSRRFVTAVVQAGLEHRCEPCGDGELVRDYVHADDAAAAHVRLLGSDVRGCVNVGSGRGVELRHIADRVARLCGVGRCADFGRRTAPEAAPRVLVADVSRLTHELGWHPSVSLDDGLTQMVEFGRHAIAAERQAA